ncbi:peptidoglycan DD-metalloendopeptidase family protein [Priestia filamentosa]|uniref:peptidoglycan DD-metalloendopeptidase family protein n=1 Tax=Priestia filamentosa TaxID=1402861 RepID=UPI001FB22EDF|nr:peptidoglycan DD-metalloendopeptidase family protein [Priestia filamentosa]MED3725169.1 peptidoglycan DD-metalloendopeptidase family protein [Priestia filamentosa]UOE61573.1 peptidoglycan DD-metalloendopeptidase family protein [Priestia filamentosa]
MKARIFGIITIVAFIVGSGSVQGNAEEAEQWIWPTEGILTDLFGTRHAKHYGIDIAAPIGTNVETVANGKVTKSYPSSTYGNVVFIKQNNGYEAVYAHLHKRLVKQGDTVRKGQIIGEVGSTGRSSGSHLHFEVHKGNWNEHKTNAVDPLPLLDEEKLYAYLRGGVTREVFQSVYGETTDDGKVKTTVQKGDTLSNIAEKYGVSVSTLQAWNNLDETTIYAGEKLIVQQ